MSKKKSSKIRIFVGYHEPNVIFQSDIFRPILTADIDWNTPFNIIRDDTGINIAERNKHYGELSGHYWVWKNFVPENDVDYIGFCHYRRFLDFGITEMEDVPFKPIYRTKFEKIFKKYTEENILKRIEGYDIVLPQKIFFNGIVYAQYLRWHPMKDINFALNVIRDKHPEYIEAAKKVMGSSEMYSCLNFVMKKELFNEYARWMFDILTTLEERTNWSEYVGYLDIRTPAYIAERFFNIWLEHNIETKKLKILNTTSLLLIGKGYGHPGINTKIPIEKYEFQVQALKDKEDMQ